MPFIGATEKEKDFFEKEFFSGDEEDKELIQFARTLRPQYKSGMLSNAFAETREWIEERYTFLELFDTALFSYEAGMRKPEALFFQLILEKLQVAPHEALFVDDFLENIIGAQKIGMQTVWYKDRSAAFPYLKSILNTTG